MHEGKATAQRIALSYTNFRVGSPLVEDSFAPFMVLNDTFDIFTVLMQTCNEIFHPNRCLFLKWKNGTFSFAVDQFK